MRSSLTCPRRWTSRPSRASNPRHGEEVERPPDPDAPAAALVFKIQADPYIGRLAYVRVYSGVLQTGMAVQNSNQDRKERIGRLVQVYAEKRQEVNELRAGDIGAVVGLEADALPAKRCAIQIHRSCWNPSNSRSR